MLYLGFQLVFAAILSANILNGKASQCILQHAQPMIKLHC